MRAKLTAWMMVFALAISALALPVQSASAKATKAAASALTIPVQGSVDGVANVLTGTLAISRFAVRDGQLVAVGLLTATVTDAVGVVRTVVRQSRVG